MVPVHSTLGLMAPVPGHGSTGAQQGWEVESPCAYLHTEPDEASFYLTKQFSNKNLYCSAQLTGIAFF